ncbi:hypothetical protein [Paraburkholderia aspalathi]|uniref:hypothetical protein n=1 Tax=Paraburkholderia aspalathi TaxID=1324617 RepID=UPI0038BCA1C4
MLIALCGCATGASLGYLPYTDIEPANYSEDFIHDINFETGTGKALALTTIDVKPFSKGGLGSAACCAALPGVGQTLHVIWRTGGNYYTPESQWVTHSSITKIKGVTSNDPDSNTSLILRFFPNNQIEAEYVAQSLKSDSPLDPRVDLLFTGQRVMRHMRE